MNTNAAKFFGKLYRLKMIVICKTAIIEEYPQAKKVKNLC